MLYWFWLMLSIFPYPHLRTIYLGMTGIDQHAVRQKCYVTFRRLAVLYFFLHGSEHCFL